jgi:hypothetical protein
MFDDAKALIAADIRSRCPGISPADLRVQMFDRLYFGDFDAATRDRIVSALSATTCEACGEPFTCGAALGACWCAEVELSDSARAELRARYKTCLCRACLEKLAGSEDPASITHTRQVS